MCDEIYGRGSFLLQISSPIFGAFASIHSRSIFRELIFLARWTIKIADLADLHEHERIF